MSLTIREEKILEAAIAGEQSPIEPVTRREAIFAKATGADVELPPARNKEEDILSKLALGYLGGGGGGDSDFSTAEVTVNVIVPSQEDLPSTFGEILLPTLNEGEGGKFINFAPLDLEDIYFENEGSITVNVPIYGEALLISHAFYDASPSLISGNIEAQGNNLIITGDGSITFNLEK